MKDRDQHGNLDVGRIRRRGAVRVIVSALLLLVFGVFVMLALEDEFRWAGAFLAVLGAATLVHAALMPRRTRELRYLEAGLRNPTGGSPRIPWWFTAIVLAALFGFLYVVATRHHL